MARQRDHALFCIALGLGDLIVVKMPYHFVVWRKIQKAAGHIAKLHGKRVKDLRGLYGEAGDVNDENPEWTAIIESAFAGDTTKLSKFYLYAWNNRTEEFDLVRKPVSL